MEAPEGVPVTVLGRLATPDLSTAIFVPSPGLGGKARVASEILESLGKRLDVTGRPRNATVQAELVPLWLTAHRTRRLIAAACQRTSDTDLRHLVEMTEATPTQVVLACDHGFGAALMSRLAAADPVLLDWPEVPAAHALDQGTDEPDDDQTARADTTLPVIEYWTFYASARRLLTTAQFAPVHDLYCEVVERLTTWLSTLGDDAGALTTGLAHESLKTLIEEQATLDEVTVVTRAAQAAYHQAGWFLDIDERELCNGLIRFPPSRTNPALYDRLRAYSEPTRAATVALYLAGATPQDIRCTTVDDLAQWHHEPRHAVSGVTVPEPAHPFLRAAFFARALDGATPSGPAFPGNDRRVNLDIRQAAADLGLNIGDAKLDEHSTIASRRVPRRAIKLERLA